MAIQYQVYIKIPDGDWTPIGDIYETELVIPSAVQDLLNNYYAPYEWRVDTYDDVTELTTTGDTWTFISQKGPWLFFTRWWYYWPDKVWKPTSGWVDIEDFEYTGGGRYKNRVVVIGHGVVYFGDA